MEKIATDTFSFERVREGGFVYVDKTAILKTLADGSLGTQFFIARPRRFGKSLAVSTLQCLFEGRRDLFKGLAIEPDWDWSKTYPVLKLDMGTCAADDAQELKGLLRSMLRREAVRLGLPQPEGATPGDAFLQFCTDLAANTKGGKFVLLVDEYDKPLLGHLGKPDVNDIRDELKAFYSVIKTCEGLQRFAFMTGVSKFSKVSVFSDLNNLNEFSMDARVATLFGYTHEEVEANFPASLAALGANYGWDGETTFAHLVKMYDGYRFAENAVPVFNPVSVGKCLSAGRFGEYWFETGTPTFLLQLLKGAPEQVDGVTLDEGAFSVYEPSEPELLPLLYQTGYLTITGSVREGVYTQYTLGFPNDEVRNAFSKAVSRAFSALPAAEHASLLTQMVEALRADDVDDMLDALSCFFANIPANITVKREKYYQTLFYAVFVLIGARTHAECWTNRGRVDAVVETPRGVYVFEFKLGTGGRDGARPSPGGPSSVSAAAALAQIKARGYAEKWLRCGKKVTLVGAAFDADMRNLSDRQVEVAADGAGCGLS